jgi:hypothetical protein
MVFHVTFGQQHPLRNGFVSIEADDRDDARRKVCSVLGDRWAMLYNDDPQWRVIEQRSFPLGRFGEWIT